MSDVTNHCAHCKLLADRLATAQTEAAELRAEVERCRQTLIGVSRWIASWGQIDLAEECADGGVMSYHVVQQEAAQQMERISTTLAQGTQPHE